MVKHVIYYTYYTMMIVLDSIIFKTLREVYQ